jgi:hypothetical protein
LPAASLAAAPSAHHRVIDCEWLGEEDLHDVGALIVLARRERKTHHGFAADGIHRLVELPIFVSVDRLKLGGTGRTAAQRPDRAHGQLWNAATESQTQWDHRVHPPAAAEPLLAACRRPSLSLFFEWF